MPWPGWAGSTAKHRQPIVHCAVVSHPHGTPAQWTWSASDAVAAATALLTAVRLANPSALSSFKNALADLAAGRVLSGGARHLVTIVGSSIGGSAAMCLAARRPELVAALVLNDSGAFMPWQCRRARF